MRLTLQEEPHFGAEYHLEALSEATLKNWRECDINCSHKLPSANVYLDSAATKVKAATAEPPSTAPKPELLVLMERVK